MLYRLRYVFMLLAFILLTGCPLAPHIVVQESIEDLQERAEEDPNDFIAHYNLGLGYTAKKQYDLALDAFHRVLDLEPHFSDACFAIFCVEYARDKNLNNESFEEESSSEIKEKMDETDNYLHSAVMYDPFFDWKISTILLNIKPSSHGNPYLKAFIDKVYEKFLAGFRQFNLGNYDRAVKKLDFLIEMNPDYTEAYLVRGFAQMHLGEYDEAIKDFQFIIDEIEEYNKKKILPIYLNPAELYYLIGNVYLRKKNLDKAEETFKKVITENMGFYMAHYKLSNIHEHRGNHTESLKELDATIIAKQDDAVFHFSKGLCLNTMSRDWEAMQEYKKAISIKPDYPMPYYTLAIVFESLKNNEEALENYRKFVDKAPKRLNTFIEKAQMRINALEEK